MVEHGGHGKPVYDMLGILGGRPRPRRAKRKKLVGLSNEFRVNVYASD